MVAQAKTRKHKLKSGQVFGELTVVKRLKDDLKVRSPNLKIRFEVKCSCGNVIVVPQYYLVREHPKSHCGCKEKSIKTLFNQEYRIWLMMHMRTEDPRHVAYIHYGGRGIRICPDWHKSNEEGFKNFLEFVGPRPSPDHSIDRIDNDLGYQPFQGDGTTRQVKWSTAKEQRANQRPRQDSSGGIPIPTPIPISLHNAERSDNTSTEEES